MFISCSWISLYTSTILISANPATRKADLDQTTIALVGLVVAGSNDQNFRPELFRRGWRRRYFNPAARRTQGESGKRSWRGEGNEKRDSLKQDVTMLAVSRLEWLSCRKLAKARHEKQMLARRARSGKFPRRAETFLVETFPVSLSLFLFFPPSLTLFSPFPLGLPLKRIPLCFPRMSLRIPSRRKLGRSSLSVDSVRASV